MKIRTRLSLTFFAIVTVVLTISSIAIYYFAEGNRKTDFYRRLKNRALNTAQVITEVKEVNADLQRRLEKNNPASLPDQYIIVIDSTGNEVYRSSGPDRLLIDSVLLQNVLKQNEIRFNSNNREAVGFVYHTAIGDYIILATAWDQYGNDSIVTLRTILILTLLAGVMLMSAISWLYAGRILNPITNIIKQVSTISEGNLNKRVDEGKNEDELTDLARTFNDMLSRLQTSFMSQKSFIANASHEIKTPITIMSGEIEVALLQDRDRNYYIRILRSVLRSLKRLNTLSTQLLLLAESANQAERKFLSYRLDDILWETKELVERAFPGCQVEIHFDIDVDPEAFNLKGDEPLIRAAILNLADNGCKYSPDNHISITVDTKSPHWIRLHFINSGFIARDEIQKIFMPFYRSVSSKTEKGFGIGLSLVANVVRLHKGILNVNSVDGVTEFQLQLPINDTHPSPTPFQPPPKAL